ncbi:MAG: response regulator [Desulfobacterium sp.]|nr:response regulator [Desulfobacterium sp.]
MTFSILIVDDSKPMRSVIKKTFRAAGYGSSDFLEAGNGLEALERLQESWVDIVISDYTMPEMNGLALLQAMKQDDLFRAIPVVVITTEGSKQRIDQFMASGAAGYIKKPFTPEQVRDMITTILGESNEDVDTDDDDFDF